MFAIAIWDARRRGSCSRATASGSSRSSTGTTPTMLAFASDLRALRRAPGFRAEVDLEALDAYLALNSVPAPMTILRGRAQASGRPPAGLGGGLGSRGSCATRGRRRPLPAPCAARARNSSPPSCSNGCATRCGLTSSPTSRSACCSPAESTRERSPPWPREASSRPVSTFSIGFSESSFNELDRARAVAARYGTEHHELVLEPDAVELLPRLVAAFDEPFGDSSALPTYLVSELAAGEVKVVLSGEGADEMFGGYYTYVADRLGPLAALAGRDREAARRAPAELEPQGRASSSRRSGSCAEPGWRRSNAIWPGRSCGRPGSARPRSRPRSPATIRSPSIGRATPRPPGQRPWPGFRTSTSASTLPTTCS